MHITQKISPLSRAFSFSPLLPERLQASIAFPAGVPCTPDLKAAP